jgi:hypothetical protein
MVKEVLHQSNQDSYVGSDGSYAGKASYTLIMVNRTGRSQGYLQHYAKRRPRYDVQREKIMAIKFDNIKGAFVNTQTDEKVSQSELLMWTAENPMEVKVGEPKLTKSKAPVKMVEEGVESITIKERI